MDQEPERFEKNVPGPFYTTGDCLACDAPEYEGRRRRLVEIMAPVDTLNEGRRNLAGEPVLDCFAIL